MNAKENGAEPAFPLGDNHYWDPVAGMSKREHFAGRAMEGILANPLLIDQTIKAANKVNEPIPESISRLAIQQADALLEALAEQGGDTK